MGDDIRSYGQHGGITAGQVNIGGSGNQSPPPKTPRWSFWQILVGLATIVGAIATVATLWNS